MGRWLAQQGLPVLDADQFAREALTPGRPATTSVMKRYGAKVQAEGGAAVDRAALGRIVFHDPAERRWLEQLIHPIVRERFDQELSLHAETPAVVLMSPLLFEAGWSRSAAKSGWSTAIVPAARAPGPRDGLSLKPLKPASPRSGPEPSAAQRMRACQSKSARHGKPGLGSAQRNAASRSRLTVSPMSARNPW